MDLHQRCSLGARVVLSLPYVVLVEGLIVELVGSLKLSSDRRAPPFQKTVNRVLQLPVHVRFGKHLKVGLKVVAWPDIFQY